MELRNVRRFDTWMSLTCLTRSGAPLHLAPATSFRSVLVFYDDCLELTGSASSQRDAEFREAELVVGKVELAERNRGGVEVGAGGVGRTAA